MVERRREPVRKGKGKTVRWSDLAVGPEMRFVHVDGCWFDEAGYGGTLGRDRFGEVWTESAQDSGSSRSENSSVISSEESR